MTRGIHGEPNGKTMGGINMTPEELAGLEAAKVSPEALKALMEAKLPGNVRELQNLLERALIVAGDGPVLPEHLGPATALERPPGGAKPRDPYDLEIPDEGLSLEKLEKVLIMKALEKAGGNKSKAAALLGLTRRTLYSRMERHGLRL